MIKYCVYTSNPKQTNEQRRQNTQTVQTIPNFHLLMKHDVTCYESAYLSFKTTVSISSAQRFYAQSGDHGAASELFVWFVDRSQVLHLLQHLGLEIQEL
jgi:hypothetical protein